MYIEYQYEIDKIADMLNSIVSVQKQEDKLFVRIAHDHGMDIKLTPARATRYAVIHTRGTQCRTMRFSDEKQLVKYIRKYAR